MTDRSRDLKESICKKLRSTVMEFGQEAVTGAILLSPFDFLGDQVGGHKHIVAPTLAWEILANVNFKVARFYEEA